MNNPPKLSVSYCDFGIVLQTQTSDQLVLPASDATEIALCAAARGRCVRPAHETHWRGE